MAQLFRHEFPRSRAAHRHDQRVGVGGREEGREFPPADLAGHVLSRFSAAEEELMKKALPDAADACLEWAKK